MPTDGCVFFHECSAHAAAHRTGGHPGVSRGGDGAWVIVSAEATHGAGNAPEPNAIVASVVAGRSAI